jgi:hypothetical protein
MCILTKTPINIYQTQNLRSALCHAAYRGISRNVGKELPLYAASCTRRAQSSSTWWRKPEIANKTRHLFKALIVATCFDPHEAIFILYNDLCNIVRSILMTLVIY